MNNVWFISMVLIVLGQRLYHKPRPFTVAELYAWAPDLKRASAAHRACTMLADKGMLEPAPPLQGETRANQITGRPARWQMTDIGREAARSAQLGAAASKRSATLTSLNQERQFPGSITHRLWTVLRARKVLTVVDAVDLLANAGDDTRSLNTYISHLLLQWHTLMPETVQVSARRVDRRKQYVLIGDVGRHPPDCLRNAPNRVQKARRTVPKGVQA